MSKERKYHHRRRTATLSVSLKKLLNTQLRSRCTELDVPISEWVVMAIEEKLDREEV